MVENPTHCLTIFFMPGRITTGTLCTAADVTMCFIIIAGSTSPDKIQDTSTDFSIHFITSFNPKSKFCLLTKHFFKQNFNIYMKHVECDINNDSFLQYFV